MSSLTIGTLTGILRADDSRWRRGLTDAELRMRGFQRDAEGRLRHLDGRFATVGDQIAAGLRRGDDEGRRFNFSLGRIAGMAGKLGGVAMSIGKIAAMLGAAVPLAGGLVATLANIAPAAGLAVTALFAVQLTTNALKLGMQGVGDAVKLALDPSKAEEFDKAIKKLAPNARAFAKEIKSLQPAFKELQQTVQDRLFKGLASVLRDMGKTVLPVLRTGLMDAADSLNSMAVGVGRSASSLARNGTLGTAIAGANAGLRNLSRIPGQVVTGLTQVGAAAAPSFGILTDWAGKTADRLSQMFTKAFQSGAMQKAIEQAIVVIGDLAEVFGNVFSIIGSVFKAAQVSGGGFIGTLKEITGALSTAFASPAVQSGLKAIFSTMATVAQTVAPLLISALRGIAPVFTALGPPVQTLIKALGAALAPVIKALGPVLAAAAKAVGSLVTAFAPLLPVIGQMVASLLPALTPLFDALNEVFVALAPVISQLASTLGVALAPILAGLTPIISILAKMIGDQLVLFIGMLGDLVVELSPTLIQLGTIFGQLLTALAPLIQAAADLGTKLLTELIPFLQPLIELVGDLAAIFGDELAAILTNVVVPALQMVTALLRGDFSGAWEAAKRLVSGAIDTIVRWVRDMPQKVWNALQSLGSKLASRMEDAGRRMKDALSRKLGESVSLVKGLPGRAVSALGDLGSRLWNAGARLIQGFIDGISSKIGAVKDKLGGLTSSLTSWKGPESLDKRLLTPAGGMLIDGFMRGIDSRIPALRGQLQGLTGAMPGMAMGGMRPGAPSGGGRAEWVVRGDGSRFAELLTEVIREVVDLKGGGNVQRAFGQR